VTKVIALITKSAGLTRAEFLHAWQVEHPPYVWALPGVRRYVQNPAVEGYRDWAYDGAAELWFDSVGDVLEHEKHFIGELTWFLADETDVPRSE
jgi:uncharacterized protein (TIGR02118 family)